MFYGNFLLLFLLLLVVGIIDCLIVATMIYFVICVILAMIDVLLFSRIKRLLPSVDKAREEDGGISIRRSLKETSFRCRTSQTPQS